jgi:acetolactate synthase-1/2/3 large subunit
VETVEEIAPALDQAFAHGARTGKPSCVNVKIAKSDFRKGAISV